MADLVDGLYLDEGPSHSLTPVVPVLHLTTAPESERAFERVVEITSTIDDGRLVIQMPAAWTGANEDRVKQASAEERHRGDVR
jgi:hypothetical protein